MAPTDPLHRRMVRPLQEFLQDSTASAVLLVIAALVALVWVNSPIGDSYDRLWGTTSHDRIGPVGGLATTSAIGSTTG